MDDQALERAGTHTLPWEKLPVVIGEQRHRPAHVWRSHARAAVIGVARITRPDGRVQRVTVAHDIRLDAAVVSRSPAGKSGHPGCRQGTRPARNGVIDGADGQYVLGCARGFKGVEAADVVPVIVGIRHRIVRLGYPFPSGIIAERCSRGRREIAAVIAGGLTGKVVGRAVAERVPVPCCRIILAEGRIFAIPPHAVPFVSPVRSVPACESAIGVVRQLDFSSLAVDCHASGRHL